MASRALGAFFALAAASAFGVSIASQAWWAGHPIVDGKEWTAKDVQVGLLGGTGCNTGGDGSCEQLPIQETIEYVSYGELGAIGLATFFAFLVMLAAWKVSDRRRGIAATSIVTTLLAAGGAGGLLYIGPGIDASQQIGVPIGWGAFALGGGVVASLLASLITRKLEPEPLRLKPSLATPHPNAPPPLRPSAPQLADIGLLPTLPPPEPMPAAPPMTRDSIRDMMSGPPVNAAPAQPVETLMASSAPVPPPLHLASEAITAPSGRAKPPSQAPAMPTTPMRGNASEAPPSSMRGKPSSVPPAMPSTPTRPKPPSQGPLGGSPPAIPMTTLPGTPRPKPPSMPPARSKEPSMPGMPPVRSKEPSMPGMPPARAKESSAPPPTPDRANESGRMPGLPAARSSDSAARAMNAAVPKPIAPSPSKPNARVPLPAKNAQPPKRESAPRMSTEPGTAPPNRSARGSHPAITPPAPASDPHRAATEVEESLANDTAVEIDHEAKKRALTDARTGKNAVSKANDTAVEIDHEAKATAQRAAQAQLDDAAADEATDIGVDIPMAPRTEPIPAQVGPDPTSQTLLAPDPRKSQTPIPSLDKPAAPNPQLAMSTAPTSLPPPKKIEAVGSGPTPACPQCESPMSWVEEHLRFYCRECRMYF